MSNSWSEARHGLLALEESPRVDALRGRPAVFLDRDGVLNELSPDPVSGDPESPLSVAEVQLIAGAAAAARALARAGFALVCVSNQPAVAKGRATVAKLQTIHEQVLALLALEHVHIDGSFLCLHHPEGVVASLSRECGCRKPLPGMLRAAADRLGVKLSSSWMVGDTDADMEAGRDAGCRTILLEYPGSAHKRLDTYGRDPSADDLGCAVPLLTPPFGDGR
jgi:D-glycero-D-manno-heptose 1,7-bisphosphate phosphatase